MRQKTRLVIAFGTIVLVPVMVFYIVIWRIRQNLCGLGAAGWQSLTCDLLISTLLILIFTAYMLIDWLEKTDALERREQVRREREWLGNLLHDMKTPLAAIRGYAEGLMDGIADRLQKRELYIRTIYHQTNELTQLVDELLCYTKDAHDPSYDFQKINANAFFDDCIEALRTEFAPENIEITDENTVGADAEIYADAAQFRRVISNIVRNCVKYMDKSERVIRIRRTDSGDFVQIEIEDNGCGIAPEELPYIFDRYYRAQAASASKIEGTGIGLSIAKKIVEDHGGTIRAQSEQGRGTKLSLTILKYRGDCYEEDSDH